MGATTPAAFDPEPLHLGLVMTFIAESAILAGQIVGHAATGLSRNVVPATNATMEHSASHSTRRQ